MAAQFRSFVDSFIWAFLIVFFIPTTLIVASWKASPGDIFYPVKIVVEDVALLVVSPSPQTSGSLRIKYTERRFAEARTLLATKQSVTGLTYLEKQVEVTTQAIAQTSDPQTRQQLAREYVLSLSDISTALVEEKAVVVQEPNPGPSQTKPIEQIAQTSSVPITQAVPTPTPTPPVISRQTVANQPQQQPSSVASPKPTPTPTPSTTPTPPPAVRLSPSVVSSGSNDSPSKSGGSASQKVEQRIVVQKIEDTHKKIEDTIEELQEIAKEAKDMQTQNKDNREKGEGREQQERAESSKPR